MSSLSSFSYSYFLTGSIDQHHSYEISLSANQLPQGKVNNSKKDKPRDVKLEKFPEKMSLDNMTSIFLNPDPQVSVTLSGYDTLFHNKKLVMKLGEASFTHPLTATLIIKGVAQGQNFEIRFDPQNRQESKAFLNEEPIELDLGPLKTMSLEKIKKELPTLDSLLEITCHQDNKEKTIRLCAKGTINSVLLVNPLPTSLSLHTNITNNNETNNINFVDKKKESVSSTLVNFHQDDEEQKLAKRDELEEKNHGNPLAPSSPSSFNLDSLQNGFLSPNELTLQSTGPVKDLSVLSVNNAKQLALCLIQGTVEKKEGFLAKIAQSMINSFADHAFPSEEAIHEITELLDGMHGYDGFRIINAFLTKFRNVVLTDAKILEALLRMLERFQLINWQRISIQSDQSEPDSSLTLHSILDEIDTTNLVEILQTLTAKLEQAHFQKDNKKLVLIQLQTVVALLDVMTARGVKEIAKEEHRKAYDTIAKFKDSDLSLKIRYLANYGKQAFRNIPNDESDVKSFFNRAFLVLRGLAKVADAISLTEPWHIASAFEAWPDFKEAFTFKEWQKSWFIGLLAVRQITYQESTGKFENLLKGIKEQPQNVAKELPLNDPYFLVGLSELSLELLSISTLDPIKMHLAIELLVMLTTHNKMKTGALCADKKSQTELGNLLVEKLQSCVNHPLSKVAEEAKKALRDLNIIIDVKPVTNSGQASLFFQKAVKDAAPLLLKLQTIQVTMERDPQLIQEGPFYIALDGKESFFSKAESVHQQILEFLKAPKAVLAVQADGGAGKTLTMRILAHDLFKHYRQNNFFPIVIPLGGMRDPVHSAISETWQEYNVSGELLDQLRNSKLLLIFDGYDEIDLTKEGANENIYQANKIAQFYPNSKSIFVSRREAKYLEKFHPAPGVRAQTLFIEPFNETKINDYLTKYVARKMEITPQELIWSLDQYTSFFTLMKSAEWREVVQNPFSLKVAADTLPIIVESYKKQNPSADSTDAFKESSGKYKLGKVISRQLFEAFACVSAIRSSNKTRGRISAESYLKYSAELALTMFEGKMRAKKLAMAENLVNLLPEEILSIPWPLTEAYKPVFGSFFTEKEQPLYIQTLIMREKGWSFIHNNYLTFFISVAQVPGELENLISLIDKYTDFVKY